MRDRLLIHLAVERERQPIAQVCELRALARRRRDDRRRRERGERPCELFFRAALQPTARVARHLDADGRAEGQRLRGRERRARATPTPRAAHTWRHFDRCVVRGHWCQERDRDRRCRRDVARVERGTEREDLGRAQRAQHVLDDGRRQAAQRARHRRVEFGELEEHAAEAEQEQRGECDENEWACGFGGGHSIPHFRFLICDFRLMITIFATHHDFPSRYHPILFRLVRRLFPKIAGGCESIPERGLGILAQDQNPLVR